jgi:AcrR family transcriptional regulator
MPADEPLGGLRERKKRQTRAAILAAASELFEARGYEHVTVAEIADAASVSVKTLFTYFRSKEDLAFADEYELRDQLVNAVRSRPADSTPTQAIAALLDRLIVADGGAGLEGYHRGYGGSPALQSRLRRMWESYEDALTGVLAEEMTGAAAAPSARLAAGMLVTMARSLTSPEVLAEARGHRSAAARRDALRAWIASAASLVSCLDQHLGDERGASQGPAEPGRRP